MCLDIGLLADDSAEGADQLVDGTRGSATDGISDTDTVNAGLVDGLVEGEKVDKVGTEGVLGGEADLEALALDELDDLNGGLGDVCHVLAVGELAEKAGSSDNDVDTVDTGLHRQLSILHCTSHVCIKLVLGRVGLGMRGLTSENFGLG